MSKQKVRKPKRIFTREKAGPQIRPAVALHKLDRLEWLSIALSAWFWMYPHPYKLAFAIVLCLPIVGLILNGIGKPSIASLVSISTDNNGIKYDFADFIEIPGLVILVRVLIDFEFESFYSILKVGTVAFILLLLLLRATHKMLENTDKHRGIIYASVIGNIAIYSYAATYGVNCVFDNSPPKVYEARVISKSISHGRRHTTYYLHIEPWGNHHDVEDISVARSQYDVTEAGDTVSIDYMEGLLGIPWYHVE